MLGGWTGGAGVLQEGRGGLRVQGVERELGSGWKE